MNPGTLVGYEIEGYFPFKTGSAAVADCPVEVEHQHEGSLSWVEGCVAAELTTLPKPAAQAMEDIVAIFDWMKRTKAVTKRDCGLHINVGLGLGAPEPSWALVLGLSQSRKVAKKFGRHNSTWCEPPTNPKVRDTVRLMVAPSGCSVEKIAVLAAKAAANPAAFGRRFSSSVVGVVDKYMDEHHSHSKTSPVVRQSNSGHGPYFEFRTPGGAGYHRREKDVLWATKIFIKAVEGACV